MKFYLFQDLKTKILFLLSILFITLFVFEIGRIFLLINYSDIFTLNVYQILKSFLISIRFDLSVISMFYILPFILFVLPIKSVKYYKVVMFFINMMFFIMLLMLIGDLVYFQESKTHIAEELFLALNDLRFLVEYSIKEYYYLLIFLVVSFLLTYYLSIKLFKKFYKYKETFVSKNIMIFVCVLLTMFLMIRGKISGMPLGMVDIYTLTNNIQEVNLILNGVFTGIHSISKKQTTVENNIDIDLAYKNMKNLLLSNNEKFVDDKNYPLMRVVTKQDLKQKYNVCIILLESWSFKHIDSLNNTNYGVTPYFDKIVSQSIVFNNAYAVGTRSMFGLYAIFSGLPLIPGFIAENSSYTYGLELKNLFSIADIFNYNDYYTAFMQTSPVDSNKYFGIMAKTNFRMKESFSEEEIPKFMQYTQKAFYGYDYDLCMFIDDKVAKLQKNNSFFVIAFTGSTHIPFTKTTDEFEKYPRTTEENKYLNSLYYADYSIGQLIEKSKQNDWFDNTIFIFIGDHVANTIENGNTLKDKYHIPFVIYAPKIFEPKKIDWAVSQLDVIPTLAHLLGQNIKFTALGVNALDEKTNHFAFICEGNNIAIVNNDNTMRHTRQNVLETTTIKNSKEYQNMEETVLSFDKVVKYSLNHNKWYN